MPPWQTSVMAWKRARCSYFYPVKHNNFFLPQDFWHLFLLVETFLDGTECGAKGVGKHLGLPSGRQMCTTSC